MTDAIKTASKKIIQKTASTTDGLNGNKIVDKTTKASKATQINLEVFNCKENIPKERYISKKRQQIIDELR